MPIRIPNLGEHNCRYLSVCAKLKSVPKPKSSAKAKKRDPMLSQTKVDGKAVLIIVLEGQKPEQHIHINVVPASIIEKIKIPKATTKYDDLQHFFDQFIGREVDVTAEGTFVVATPPFPRFIELAMAPIRTGQITVTTTGADLSVQGTPISGIRWIVRKDQKEVMIEFRTKRTTKTITESYLEDLLGVLVAGLNRFSNKGEPYARTE